MELRTAAVLLTLAAIAAGYGDQLDVLDDLGLGGEQTPGVARVLRVVDGDTIRVRLDGREETVRYIGVDTPETKKPGSPVECYGKKASAFTEKVLAGEDVTLELDVEERDRYGRTLAYVRRARDGFDVNAELVRRGYAMPLTVPPNVRHADRYRRLGSRARAEGRGLWSACG